MHHAQGIVQPTRKPAPCCSGLGSLVWLAGPTPQRNGAAVSERVFVISDLHLGASQVFRRCRPPDRLAWRHSSAG